MSTPPISVPITTLDLTAPGFDSATARSNAFKSSMEGAGYSMHEATASARLFNEELGTHMSRHLSSIMASSALLGPALQAALPIAAAVGFAEVVSKIADKMSAWYNNTEALKQFQDRMDETSKSIVELLGATERLDKETALMGASAQQKWATELEEATEKVRAQNASISDLSNTIYKLKQGQGEAMGGGISIHGNTSADIPDLQRIYSEQVALGAKLEAERAHAQAELTAAQRAGMDEYQEQIAAATEQVNRLREAWVQAMGEAEKSSKSVLGKGESPGEKQIAAIDEQIAKWHEVNAQHVGINEIANKYTEELERQKKLIQDQIAALAANPLAGYQGKSFSDMVTVSPASPAYSGTNAAMNLANVQTNQNDAIKAAQQIYEQTATAAQKYSDTMNVLYALLTQVDKATGLGRISQEQFDAAMVKATKDLDGAGEFKKYYLELGKDIGSTIEKAALFEESWSKAFKTLLADVTKLVLQMFVFKALATTFGGAGGGFFGALFSGLAGGRASGGAVSFGSSYLVGESGPELFTPGASGAITPNSALGGQTVQLFDMRGSVVSGDVVKRAEMAAAMRVSENRAVARAQAGVADIQARR